MTQILKTIDDQDRHSEFLFVLNIEFILERSFRGKMEL